MTAAPEHHVYIVRCADGTFYTGYARDPRARAAQHNAGRGARYTRGRLPVRLVYTEACPSKGAALSREYAIKQLSRQDKQGLIRTAQAEARTRRNLARLRRAASAAGSAADGMPGRSRA